MSCFRPARPAWLVRLPGAARLPLWPKDRDRLAFLILLRRALGSTGLSCHGFCLLGAEARLVLPAAPPASLLAAFESACRAYACYWRQWYPSRARLFRPLRAAEVPPALLHAVLAHVETAPVRDGLCAEPWLYRWSSAPAHCALGPSYLPLAGEGPLSPARWLAALQDWPRQWDAIGAVTRLSARARPLRTLAAPAAPPAPLPLFPAPPPAARAARAAL